MAGVIFKIIGGFFGEGIGTMIGTIFDYLSAAILLVFLGIFRSLWNIIGTLIITFTGRREEFAADEFAVNLGYGPALLMFFNFVSKEENDSSPRTAKEFFNALSTVTSTHPSTHKRIQNVQEKMQNNIPLEIISVDATSECSAIA